jgi:hypothetical protein
VELAAGRQIGAGNIQPFGEASREERVKECFLAIETNREQVLAYDGYHGPFINELNDPFPETLGVGDSVPPKKSNRSNSLETSFVSAIDVGRFRFAPYSNGLYQAESSRP